MGRSIGFPFFCLSVCLLYFGFRAAPFCLLVGPNSRLVKIMKVLVCDL
jgi:hypothetical protein